MKFAFIMLFAFCVVVGIGSLNGMDDWKPHPTVLVSQDKPVRAYMIYHPEKEKWLGESAIGGFTSWVEPAEAIILSSREAGEARVDTLLGSKDDVELKAFLLLPVALKEVSNASLDGTQQGQ